METILKRIILENQEIIANKQLISRNYSIPVTDNITVLTGIRRCGKTYMLYEKAKLINPKCILFLDFEDERLIALFSLTNYDVIVDAYKIDFFPNFGTSSFLTTKYKNLPKLALVSQTTTYKRLQNICYWKQCAFNK